jgi:hypothetical protein
MFGMVLAIVVTILGITTWARHNWATRSRQQFTGLNF